MDFQEVDEDEFIPGVPIEEIDAGPPKGVKLKQSKESGWIPPFGPTQRKVFDCAARWMLMHGERFSGKTFTAGNKILRHCWENNNALALVIVGVRRQATAGGIWHKLLTEVLPMWKNNLDGFEHSDQRQNTEKDLFIWVGNRHGGWSMIQLVSIPDESRLTARVKGIEASMIFVDELVGIGGEAYFTSLIQQLGRRKGTPKHLQQYLAATNPGGPSHWAYDRFFVMPEREDGTRDERYAVFHIPFAENPSPDAQEYLQNVLEATRNDPIEYERMINGKWVDRPAGDAIFKDQYSEDMHVRPHPKLAKPGQGIVPLDKFPVTVGYDPGPKNFSIHLLQRIPIGNNRMVWTVFDERDHVGRRDPYMKVVFGLMDRMSFWMKLTGHSFQFEHISDEAAFSHFNNRGSFDAKDIYDLSVEYIRRNPKCGLEPIRMKPCPKGRESISARIRELQGMLMDGDIMVSATCKGTREMLLNAPSKKVKDGVYDPLAGLVPQNGVYKHKIDSLTYPIHFYHSAPRRRYVETGDASANVFRMGV
jgi:hypothetical protein